MYPPDLSTSNSGGIIINVFLVVYSEKCVYTKIDGRIEGDID